MTITKYKLNNWAVVCQYNPYAAPEQQRQCLMGKVEGHPEHADGKTVVTSSIVGKFEGQVVTANSLIELGWVRAEYEAEFPRAKERLMESLSECTLRWDGAIR